MAEPGARDVPLGVVAKTPHEQQQRSTTRESWTTGTTLSWDVLPKNNAGTDCSRGEICPREDDTTASPAIGDGQPPAL